MSNPNIEQKIPIKDVIQLRSLITNGKEAKVNYEIEFYKEVYNKSVVVTLRPLTNSEFDDLFLEMCSTVEDPEVLEEIYNPKDKKDKNKKQDSKTEEKPELTPEEKARKNKINIGYSKALKYYKHLLIYNSMKDFIEGLTIDDVKLLEAKNDIYDKICEISGRTDEIMKKISRFRELRSKSEPDPATK